MASMTYVAAVASSARGGADAHIAGMVSGLEALGWDVELVVPQGRRLGALSVLLFEIRAAARVLKGLATEPPQVVYTRIGPTSLLATLAPLMRWRGTGLVGELNGPPSTEFLNRRFGRYAAKGVMMWVASQLRACDRVRCVSPGLVEYAASNGAKAPFLLSNGSDIEPAQPRHPGAAVQEDVTTLVFAGVEAPWYELALWEEVVRRNPRSKLVICTDERGGDRIRERSGDLLASGRLELHPWLSPTDLREVLLSADFALLPLGPKHPSSDVIGSPLKLYDYMRLGLPIISTAVDGIPSGLSDLGVRFYEFGDLASAENCLRGAQVDYDQCLRQAAARDPESHSWLNRARELSGLLENV